MSAATPFPAAGATTADKRYEPSMEEILASIRRIIADDQTLPGKAPEPARPTSLHQPVAPPTPAPFPAPAAPQAGAVHRVPVAEPKALEIEPEAELPEQRAHGIVAAPQFVAPDGPSADHILPRELPPEPHAFHVPASAPRAPEPEVLAPEVYDDIDENEVFFETATEPTPAIAPQAVYEDVREKHTHDRHEEPTHEETTASLFSTATDTSLTSAFNMLAASRLADNSDELMNLAREMIRPLLRSWIDDNLPSMVERMVRAEIERVARGGR